MKSFVLALMGLSLAICGCQPGNNSGQQKVSDGTAEANLPVFKFGVSEYPSWSTYTVAAKAGLINPKEGGEPGVLEKKWGVDIVLEVKDYDACLTMYSSGVIDAVCITNMDTLNPAMTRPSTAIMPTSTSVGADKIIGSGFTPGDNHAKTVGEYLQGKKIYGLQKSVSEYTYVRGMEILGLDSRIATFVNLDPAGAATALQTGSNDVKTICVWNPFALQTLRTQKSANVVFDSSLLPEEIIDMVVVSNKSLQREKGQEFAACLCDIFYEVSKRLNDPKSADVAYKALGEDFSNLSVEDMKLCCKETRFYATPESGVKLFSDPKFQTTMGTVVRTCQKIGVLEQKVPTLGYGDSSSQLNFETKYMKLASGGGK